MDAGFIWTEPHSMRLKVKLTVQGEVLNGAILQQVGGGWSAVEREGRLCDLGACVAACGAGFCCVAGAAGAAGAGAGEP